MFLHLVFLYGIPIGAVFNKEVSLFSDRAEELKFLSKGINVISIDVKKKTSKSEIKIFNSLKECLESTRLTSKELKELIKEKEKNI